MARFHGAWIGTWQDDRHIRVVERVKPDGHANVVFAKAASALYDPSFGMNREWWRDEATIADGVLTMRGFRIFRYAFDGPDRLYLTATNSKSGGVTSGALVRAAAARLAAGDRPVEWPWPGERIRVPHIWIAGGCPGSQSASWEHRDSNLGPLIKSRSNPSYPAFGELLNLATNCHVPRKICILLKL
jgi:hypothetical protein